jgi:hypothetical protein
MPVDFPGHSLFYYYRWTGLNTATLKFSSIYNAIQRNPPSGTSPDNWMTSAKRIYQEQIKGMAFTSTLAWQKLRNTQKWRANCNTELASSSVGVFSDTINQESKNSNLSFTLLGFSIPTVQLASSIARPIGQKAAKKPRIDDTREGSSSVLFAKVAQE